MSKLAKFYYPVQAIFIRKVEYKTAQSGNPDKRTAEEIDSETILVQT